MDRGDKNACITAISPFRLGPILGSCFSRKRVQPLKRDSEMADSSNVSKRPSNLPLRPTSASQEPPSSPPIRNVASSGALTHRSSFAENLRSHPPSPRSQRHPSFTQATQAAVRELLNHPPATKPADPRFVGRDWRHIRVGELVSNDDVRFVESGTGVEEATKVHANSAQRRLNVDRI
jgi:hypothetical protein